MSHSDTQKGLVFKLYHIARNYMLDQKRKLVEQFSQETHQRILDIGCGTGYFLNYMKQHNWNTVGIEQDENARKFAESRFNLEVFPPEGITSFAENSFNTITLWHVLEHIHNLNAIMESIRHILTPDGTLVIALPNPDSYDAEKYKDFWAAYDVPRHLWHFKPDVIVRLCEQHGFSLITKKRMPLDGFYVSILTEKYKGKGFLSLPLGILTGMFSMLAGWINIDKTSSLIYVFKKNN
ncbi:MAG: methyltransferase domain-containing protein [Calditrichia bacterium]